MSGANAGADARLESRIKAIVARHLGVPVEELDVSSRLVEDLGADSLDVAEIELAIEDQFGLEIAGGRSWGLASVGDAIAYVDAHGG